MPERRERGRLPPPFYIHIPGEEEEKLKFLEPSKSHYPVMKTQKGKYLMGQFFPLIG